MHPKGAFGWDDEVAMLNFAARIGLAHIFVGGAAGLAVVHAPVTLTGGKLQFHLSRRNRAAPLLDGAMILVSIVGRQGYQSANWYASADQVPTWLYEAVEIEGVATMLDVARLSAQVDALSNVMEGLHSPEVPWTRAKMTPGKYEAMLKAIVGFEITASAIRGTRKFNQHKSPADLDATIAGQSAAGRNDIVTAIAEMRSR